MRFVQDAHASLYPSFSYQVQEAAKSAQLRVRTKLENVSGVMLPNFESYQEGANGMLAVHSIYLDLVEEGDCLHD